MSGQRHIIKRQVVDLKIDSTLDAAGIQDTVSQIIRDRLMPVLSYHLDNMGGSGKMIRIDKWEIDLGVIHIDELEQLLEENLIAQLAAGKPVFVSEPEPVASGSAKTAEATKQADVDLVAYFLQTGTFPWWAKETNVGVFKSAVDNLISRTHNTLNLLLERLIPEQEPLKRLIYTCDDALLYRIVQKIAPANKTGERVQKRLYKAFGHKISERQFREAWWYSVLPNVIQAPSASQQRAIPLIQLFFDVMGGEEERLRLNEPVTPSHPQLIAFYNDQVKVLNMILESFDPINSYQNRERLKKISDLLTSATVDERTTTDHKPLEVINAVQVSLNEIRRTHGLKLVNYAAKVSNDGVLGIEQILESHQASASQSRSEKSDVFDAVKRPAKSSASQSGNENPGTLDPSKKQDKTTHRTNTQRVDRTEHPVTKKDATEHQSDQQYSTDPANLVNSFSDSDKLYIGYSGLVLLAPFLPRLFSNIGLVERKAFVDQPSAEKACLLLQYIAEGQAWERSEPLLPLNKLLCGIGLFDPIDMEVEIKQEEMDVADDMLRAVIQNAPLWKSLSADALRSAYLQREGLLSSRDGNWLLQVERMAYDILIDKLPWTFSTIKLPWMSNLIFVEW